MHPSPKCGAQGLLSCVGEEGKSWRQVGPTEPPPWMDPLLFAVRTFPCKAWPVDCPGWQPSPDLPSPRPRPTDPPPAGRTPPPGRLPGWSSPPPPQRRGRVAHHDHFRAGVGQVEEQRNQGLEGVLLELQLILLAAAADHTSVQEDGPSTHTFPLLPGRPGLPSAKQPRGLQDSCVKGSPIWPPPGSTSRDLTHLRRPRPTRSCTCRTPHLCSLPENPAHPPSGHHPTHSPRGCPEGVSNDKLLLVLWTSWSPLSPRGTFLSRARFTAGTSTRRDFPTSPGKGGGASSFAALIGGLSCANAGFSHPQTAAAGAGQF